jgi:5-methylcytosine-specific restriction endonuclease McrA
MLAQTSGSYTPAELDAVLKAHTNPKTGELICAWCGKPIKGKYHIDHWIPLRRGGLNVAGNLRVMHGRCNLDKRAKLPQELGRLL